MTDEGRSREPPTGADEALRNAPELLGLLLENMPAAAYINSRDGVRRLVNRAWEAYWGVPRDRVLGRAREAVFPPEVARAFRASDEQVVATGAPLAFLERIDVGGVTRWFHTVKFPLRDAAGHIQAVGGISLDVTDRRQAEEAARQSAERLEAVSRRLVQVQEEERRRLALELHDDVGQLLTSLKFAVEAAAAAPPAEAAAKMNEARALIDEALTRVRDLSSDLRPALLDHLGLLPAVRGLIDRYAAGTGVRVSFHHAGLDGRLPPDLETAAYRVVQEALTNVARHAGVKEAAVRLWVDAGRLQVQVEDQGAGFAPDAVLAAGRSNGLPGMRERVMLLGGRLVIESAPGDGTHLLAELPLGDQAGRKIDEHFHRLGR
jgi:PAS domain S-box-containing protein